MLRGFGWRGLAVLGSLLALALPTVSRGEELVVGFQEFDFYPYGRPDAESTYVGYLRDLLDAYALDRGHQLRFEVVPVKRLFAEFERGEIDLFVPDNPAWSQDVKGGGALHYSEVIAVALDGFAVLPGRQEEQPGEGVLHIGSILGVTIDPLFDEGLRESLRFDRTTSFESIFRALMLERVDAVYCNRAVTHDVLRRLGVPVDSVTWSQTLPRFRSEFRVSSGRAELIADFDRWLQQHEDLVEAMKREFGLLTEETLPWGD